MLELLKNIFKKKIEAIGTLVVEGKESKNIRIYYENEKLKIHVNKDNTFEAELSHVKDFELSGNTLSFVIEGIRYKLESKDSKFLYENVHSMIENSYLFDADGAVYSVFDDSTKFFVEKDKNAKVRILLDDKYYLKIDLDIKDMHDAIHFEEIKPSTPYYTDSSTNSFVWSVYTQSKFYTFAIKFKNDKDFSEFSNRYLEACYKSNNKDLEHYKEFTNMAEYASEKYSITSNPHEEKEERTESSNDSLDDWNEYDEYSEEKNEFNADDLSNRNLVLGKNRLFLTRGASLGIFDLDPTNINFNSRVKNAVKDPQKIISRDTDNGLLILEKDERSKLGFMDLEKGQVIEKWDVKTDMNDYFNSVSGETGGTLIGLGDKSLFRIDPRAKEKVVEEKTYKTNNGFISGNATSKGHIAAASKKGDIRLYDKINIRAKTLLNGFGDEIFSTDLSEDGSLILGTCKDYILLFQAHADYSKTVKDRKTPIRLQLKPQHLTLSTKEISFTPAKFDGRDEYIISGTGPYILKWRVRDVLNGDIYSYTIKTMPTSVVDENFISDGDGIVVALKNDVRRVETRELKKPRY
ncbi:hypothetical protein ENBRE01_0791 [Enteropsectra breve]|nr:hypothetical protein ENBRE01_0791 [Enteropsectra breve]